MSSLNVEELESEINERLNEMVVKSLFDHIIEHEDIKLLEFISRHREYFHVKGFEKRVVLLDITKDINFKSFILIRDFLRQKREERQFVSVLEKFSDVAIRFLASFIRELMLHDEVLNAIKSGEKLSVKTIERKIKEVLNKSHEVLNLDEDSKEYLMDAINALLQTYPEYYLSLLVPESMLEVINEVMSCKKRRDFRKYEEVVETLEKLNLMFPIYTVYFCDNVDSHDVNNPPFFLFILPHLRVPRAFDKFLRCPVCNKKLKKIKILGFIPPISKIILDNEILRYFIIYLIRSNFSWLPYPGDSNVSETDVLIINENKAIVIEVKQHKDTDDVMTLNNHLNQLISQVEKKLGKIIEIETGNGNTRIEIAGGIGISNHRKDKIEKALKEYDSIRRKLKSNNRIRILSFEEYKELPGLIEEFWKTGAFS